MKKKIFIFISPSFFLIVLLFFYLLIIFKNNNVNISSKNDSETIATTDVQFEKYSDSVTAIGDYEYSCDYYWTSLTLVPDPSAPISYYHKLGISNGKNAEFLIDYIHLSCVITNIFNLPTVTVSPDKLDIYTLMTDGYIKNLTFDDKNPDTSFSSSKVIYYSKDISTISTSISGFSNFSAQYPNNILTETSSSSDALFSYDRKIKLFVDLNNNNVADGGFWSNMYGTIDATQTSRKFIINMKSSLKATVSFKFVDKDSDYDVDDENNQIERPHASFIPDTSSAIFVSGPILMNSTNTISDVKIFGQEYLIKISDSSYVQPNSGSTTDGVAHLFFELDKRYLGDMLMSYDVAINQVSSNWNVASSDQVIFNFYNKHVTSEGVPDATLTKIDNAIRSGKLIYSSISGYINRQIVGTDFFINTLYSENNLGDNSLIKFINKYINADDTTISNAIDKLPYTQWAIDCGVSSSGSDPIDMYYPLNNSAINNRPINMEKLLNLITNCNTKFELSFMMNTSDLNSIKNYTIKWNDVVRSECEITFDISNSFGDVENSSIFLRHLKTDGTVPGFISSKGFSKIFSGNPAINDQYIGRKSYTFTDLAPTQYQFKKLSMDYALQSVSPTDELLKGKTADSLTSLEEWYRFLRFIYGKKPSDLLWSSKKNWGFNYINTSFGTSVTQYVNDEGYTTNIPFDKFNFFSLREGYTFRYSTIDDIISKIVWYADDNNANLIATVSFNDSTIPDKSFSYSLWSKEITGFFVPVDFSTPLNMRPSDVVEHDFLRTRVRFVDDSTTNDQLFTCSLSRTLFMTEILLNTNIVLIPDDIHGTLMVSMLVYSLVSQRSVIQTDDNKQQVLISTSAFKNNPTPTPVPIPPDNNDTGNSSLPIYFGVGGGAILFFGVIIVSIHSYRKHLLWKEEKEEETETKDIDHKEYISNAYEEDKMSKHGKNNVRKNEDKDEQPEENSNPWAFNQDDN